MAESEDFPLRRELEAFEARRSDLLGHCAGKFALIHDAELAGIFDTEADGIREGYRRFGNVAFLVKQVTAVDAVEFIPVNLAA